MYAKLFTSIYQGTLRGNSHGLLVFTNLLAHCDKDGCVDMHPRAIAEEVGLSVEQVRAALLTLEAPDVESRSPEEDGRRIVRMDEHRDWGWCVVNYIKYRAIRSEDDRREQNRLAQERWRNKNKPPSADGKQDKPIQKQIQKQKQEEEKTARKRATPALKKGMPEDFGISTAVRSWAAQKGYDRLPEHLDAFERKCKAKGYQYADWDAAFQEAVREDWAKLRGSSPRGVAPPPESVTNGDAARSAEYLRQQEEHARQAVAPPANIRALVRKMTGMA